MTTLLCLRTDEYLEKRVERMKRNIENLEKEIEDIEFVEDTLEQEKETCLCDKCHGTGTFIENGMHVGEVHAKCCDCCGGTGYTTGEEQVE